MGKDPAAAGTCSLLGSEGSPVLPGGGSKRESADEDGEVAQVR